MKIHALLACLLALPAVATAAPERYRCTLVVDAGDGAHKADETQSVELVLEGDKVEAQMRLGGASKDLTFRTCAPTGSGGGNFSKWFETECRTLASLDGSSFSVDLYLTGAYAGISPRIDPAYAMHETLAAIGAKLKLGTPARTFVVYADRKPQLEFFCYSVGVEPKR